MIGSSIKVAILIGLLAATAAPVKRELIEQALDEPSRITLENIRLGDAVELITEQTGVRLVMPPETMRLAPYGAETAVQHVDIANMPLRFGLTELFAPLGMTFTVHDDHVEIVPKEPLLWLGRPPTWTELQVVNELAQMQLGIDRETLSKFRSRIRFEVPVPQAWSILARAIQGTGAGSGDDVLTIACSHLGWVWYPEGELIVVAPQEQMVQRRLQEPISLRIHNRPLVEAVQALGREAGVSIRLEPAAVASLPPAIRGNFSINVDGARVDEVLDRIAAYANLGWIIARDSVVFFAPTSEPASPPAVPDRPSPAAADPFVAKMVVPLDDGKTLEWLIRRSELPEDLQRMREQDLRELFEAVRRRQ